MKFLLTYLLVLVELIGYSQGAGQSFDLKDCLLYARGNSPIKRQHYLSQQRREMQWQLQKSKDLPQIRTYANYSYFLELPTYIFPEEEGQVLSAGDADGPFPIRLGQPHNLFAGARVSQTLFSKRWFYSDSFHELNDEISELSEQANDEEIIEKVALTFFSIQKLQSTSDLILSRIERLNKMVDVLELQSRERVINKVEVDKLKLNIARLKAENTRLVGAIESQSNQLKVVMGMPLESPAVFRYTTDNLGLAMQEGSEGSSAQVQLLEKQEQFGHLQENAIAADYFPKVNAFADFQFQAQRNSLNFISDERWFPQHLVGIGINFPIFTGFEKRTRIQEEGVKVEEIKLNRELAASKEALERKNAESELQTARLILDNSVEQKELANVILSQVQLQYQEGVAPLNQLLSAEIEKNEADNQYEEANFDYKLAQINYLKATNRLRALLQ